MRRLIAAVLGLGLVGSLWLPWADGCTGWEWFTYSDVVACLAAAAAIAFPPRVAAALSVAALIGVAATPARSPFDGVGLYVGLACGAIDDVHAASLAAVHARLRPWVAPLACAVASLAVGVGMALVIPEDHTAAGLRYGAWAGPGCLLILLATTASIARAERRWGARA